MKSFYSRQQPQVALLSLSPKAVADGGYSIDIPHGALVTNVSAQTVTGFNTGGTTPTAKLSVKDNDDTFVNDQAVTAAGNVTVAKTDKFYPQGGLITANVTEGAASGQINATDGQVLLVVEYLQLGVEHTIQG